jgi:hypothetical protein
VRDRQDDDDVLAHVLEDDVRKRLREHRAAHAEEKRSIINLHGEQPMLCELRRLLLHSIE